MAKARKSRLCDHPCCDYRKTDKRLHPDLVGGNIITHLENISKLNEDIYPHFTYDSPLYRAIEKHVLSPDCILIERPKDLYYYRGCGAMRFIRVFIWARPTSPDDKMLILPRDKFSIEFSLSFIDSEEIKQKTFQVLIPLDLEVKFTQAKFDSWVDKIARKRKAENQKADLQQLSSLMAKYPGFVSEKSNEVQV